MEMYLPVIVKCRLEFTVTVPYPELYHFARMHRIAFDVERRRLRRNREMSSVGITDAWWLYHFATTLSHMRIDKY